MAGEASHAGPEGAHHGKKAVIEARSLTKHYGDKLAVDQLSFTVRPGVVTGFLGPNGSGKSTTMRMIVGLDLPSGGSATVNGKRYRDLAWPLHEVGALLEAKAIHPGRSARGHLQMLADTHGISRGRIDEVLDLVGLGDAAGRRAGKFSLGMGQRLGIAAALLGDPGVLLFDEPVNGLDPDGIRWVRNLLRSLAGEGRTVLVSSHLMSEMALTADDVVVIGRGRLIAETSIGELTSQSSQRYVTVRVAGDPDLLVATLRGAGASVVAEGDGALTVQGAEAAGIGELAGSLGVVLHELSPHAASLEEAFMELTDDSIDYRGGPAAPLVKGGSR